MGPGVQTIGVQIRGDNASLRSALAQSKQEISQFSRTAADSMRGAGNGVRAATDQITDGSRRATAAMRSTTDAAHAMGTAATGSLSSLASVIAQIAGPLGLGAIISQIARTGIGFHDFSQRAQISLQTMLGSTEQAREFLADILAFAKQTPFAFPELTASAQKLLAFGMNAQQIIPTLKALGDAAAATGSGVEMVNRLAGVIGQIQAKGRLQGDEILQLSEAGVPALRILANQAGVTAAVFSKQVTAGLVDSETAITGLVKGLEEGTTGINGTTVAFAGLMDQIKESGGWTATVDSARSGFRNMSAALTESLLPSLTSSIRLGTDAMGVVGDMAEVFNRLPGPVRDAALAVTGLAIANRLLGDNLRTAAVGGLTNFRASLNASKASAEAMGYQIGTTRAAMMTMGVTARATGSALLSAFGGPAGIAIAALTAGITAFASSQAAARQRAEELATTLDEQARITAETRKSVVETLSATQGWGPFTRDSGFDAAEKLGLDLQVVTDAALGSIDALEQVRAAVQDVDPAKIPELARAAGMTTQEYIFAMRDVSTAVKGSNATLDEAIEKSRQQALANGASADSLGAVSRGYRIVTTDIRAFTEEQVKAQDAAADAARRAYDSATRLATTSLNTATAEDLAAAQDKVTDATRRLRDAEDARQQLAGKEDVSASERIRAEESVADARKALDEATQSLSETEQRTDPVANYRRQVQEMLTTAQNFAANVQKLADQGLNGKTLSEIIAAGPEGSKDTVDALLADPSLVGLTNSVETQMAQIGSTIEQQAKLAQIAAESAGTGIGGNLGLALRIAAEEGTADTIQAIADKLGEDPTKIWEIGRQYGLTFMSGFADAMQTKKVTLYADGSFSTGPGAPKGYALGGVFPGYTPGVDVGLIGVSGGEAIMRPEWTRAVGAQWVDRMNYLARTGGVSAVRQAMRAYLGGFANGGIAYATPPAPHVVTVPVSTTHERYSPVNIDKAFFTDPTAAGPYADRARAQNNVFGG